jgi:hypothetical protein
MGGKMEQTEQEISKARALLHKKFQIVERIKRDRYQTDKPLRERMKESQIVYEGVKARQREAFFEKTVKRWAELKADKVLQEELWNEFWVEFAENRINSIREFMESKGYVYPESADKYLMIADIYKNADKEKLRKRVPKLKGEI